MHLNWDCTTAAQASTGFTVGATSSTTSEFTSDPENRAKDVARRSKGSSLASAGPIFALRVKGRLTYDPGQ
jgi:hypothetical protein